MHTSNSNWSQSTTFVSSVIFLFIFFFSKEGQTEDCPHRHTRTNAHTHKHTTHNAGHNSHSICCLFFPLGNGLPLYWCLHTNSVCVRVHVCVHCVWGGARQELCGERHSIKTDSIWKVAVWARQTQEPIWWEGACGKTRLKVLLYVSKSGHLLKIHITVLVWHHLLVPLEVDVWSFD